MREWSRAAWRRVGMGLAVLSSATTFEAIYGVVQAARGDGGAAVGATKIGAVLLVSAVALSVVSMLQMRAERKADRDVPAEIEVPVVPDIGAAA